MAITLGTISDFGGTGGWPWNATTAATIDTTGADGLLCFLSTTSSSKDAPGMTHEGIALTMLYQLRFGNGTLWAYGLSQPIQTATGSINISGEVNTDNWNLTVIPVNGCDTTNPFGNMDGTAAEAGTITNNIETSADESIILTGICSIFGPSVGSWTIGGTPTPTFLGDNAVQSSCPIKSLFQEIPTAETDATTTNQIPWNWHGIVSVEILDGGAPAGQTLTVPSIENTDSGLGNHLQKDPSVDLLAPQGLLNSSALGALEVVRMSIAGFEINGAGNTATGTPAVTVERTSGGPSYSISRVSTPVMPGEKRYFEFIVDNIAESSTMAIGVAIEEIPLDLQLGAFQSNALSWDSVGDARHNNLGLATRPIWNIGDVLMVAVDLANGWVFMGQNGEWWQSNQSVPVNHATGVGRANTTVLSTSIPWYAAIQTESVGDKITANFGRSPFTYEPPAGYIGLDAGGPITQILEAPSLSLPAPLFGSHRVDPQSIYAGALEAPASVIGSHSLAQILTAQGFSNTSLFGEHSLKQITTLMLESLVAEASLFGSHSLASSIDLLVPSLQGSQSLLGTPAVAQAIYPVGIENLSLLGQPSLLQRLLATGITEASFLGSPNLKIEVWDLILGGINNESILGTFQINQFINVSSLLNNSFLGNHLISEVFEGDYIVPLGISNTSILNSFQVNQGIKAQGLQADASIFGDLIIVSEITIEVPGLLNSSAIGTPRVSTILSLGAGILNESVLGSPSLLWKITPESLINNSEFGLFLVDPGSRTLMPNAIINTTQMGLPELISTPPGGSLFIKVNGYWTPAETIYVRIDGEWREVDHIREKTQGTWNQIV